MKIKHLMAALPFLLLVAPMVLVGCGNRGGAEGEKPPVGMRDAQGHFRQPGPPAKAGTPTRGGFRQPGPPGAMGGGAH